MKNRIIKIIVAIIIVVLIIGNIYSFTNLKERDRIIDKLEAEIKEQKKEIKTSKNNIDELEYQVDYYEEMYGKYNFEDKDDEDNNTSSNQNENTNQKQLTYEQYQNMLKKKESFILVISQTYCSHCIEYKPHFFKVINSNKIPGYDLDILTLSESEYNKIIDSLKISGTPTTLFYRDGVEIPESRLDGNKSEEELIKALKKYGFM